MSLDPHYQLPRSLGPYTLLRKIAVGGMAELYIAKTKGLGGFEKLVAIKVIHPQYSSDRQFIDMLIEEAKISVILTHGNIGQIFDLGCIDTSYFIVMEYIDGANIADIVKKSRSSKTPVPLDVCMYVAAEICSGLDYAHGKTDSSGARLNIVHRDISPQNILVSYSGEVKLVDFGIAKASLRSQETESGVIKGKYQYMSPEQAWGDPLDSRSDIFSVGIVLYELLTGELLYAEPNAALLFDQIRKADILPPTKKRVDIPPALSQIVMRALAKKPEDRFQTAGEMSQALLKCLTEVSPSFAPTRLAEFVRQLFNVKTSVKADAQEVTRKTPVPFRGEDLPSQEERKLVAIDRRDFRPDPSLSVISKIADDEGPTLSDNVLEAKPKPDDKGAGTLGTPSKKSPSQDTLRPPAMGTRKLGKAAASRHKPSPSELGFSQRRSQSTAQIAVAPSKTDSNLTNPNELAENFDLPTAPTFSDGDDNKPPLFSRSEKKNEKPDIKAHSSANRPWEAWNSPTMVPPPVWHPLQTDDSALKQSRYRFRFSAPWIFGGGALILVALLAFVFTQNTENSATLEVISVPAGGLVFVDNVDMGSHAPVRVATGLPPLSTHLVRVTMPGHEPWEKNVQMTSGVVTEIAVLKPQEIIVHVDSAPEGAYVWVDGVLHGSTPLDLHGLTVDQTITLRASLAGHEETVQRLELSHTNLTPRITLTLPPKNTNSP